MPQPGETITGTVVSASKSEIRLDINGIHIGVIRGRELYNESVEYGNLTPGQTVEATIMEMENENGEMELSFRFAGQQKAWENLKGIISPLKKTKENQVTVSIWKRNLGKNRIGHASLQTYGNNGIYASL